MLVGRLRRVSAIPPPGYSARPTNSSAACLFMMPVIDPEAEDGLCCRMKNQSEKELSFTMRMRKGRIPREAKTVESMIRIYCRDLHGKGGQLCEGCEELLQYARARLNKCPFQEGKTTCAHCKVHCYRPDRRELIKTVMRYSGPRMTYRHPLLALRHFLDGFRKSPKQRRGKRNRSLSS